MKKVGYAEDETNVVALLSPERVGGMKKELSTGINCDSLLSEWEVLLLLYSAKYFSEPIKEIMLFGNNSLVQNCSDIFLNFRHSLEANIRDFIQ